MEDWASRVIHNFDLRMEGPLHFRFIFQPLMALYFAARDGINDAKQGHPAYLWSICSHPDSRADLLRHGWTSIGKIFLLAVVLDVVYQLLVFGKLYPVEALLVATMLAVFPYLLARGPINRLAQHFGRARRKHYSIH